MKIRPYITEIYLMGRKESNQTNKDCIAYGWLLLWRRKVAGYTVAGTQVLWNIVVDYIVQCWL